MLNKITPSQFQSRIIRLSQLRWWCPKTVWIRFPRILPNHWLKSPCVNKSRYVNDSRGRWVSWKQLFSFRFLICYLWTIFERNTFHVKPSKIAKPITLVPLVSRRRILAPPCCSIWVSIFLGNDLKHWGRDKMAASSQTTLLNALSWMKCKNFD